MGVPYATTADLVARWRPLTVSETGTATVLLGDASVKIRAEFPDVDERIAADPQTLDPDVPKMVVCAMVKRAMLAGTDEAVAASVQEAAGPFSRSTTFVNPTGDLYLTSAERRMLRTRVQQAFTVRMGYEASQHLPWCASMFGALYCSCGVDIAGTPIFEGGVDY